MAHSYVSGLFHCVFSTRERRPVIAREFRDCLWSFMGGIARTNGMKAFAVGGTEDHVHILLAVPATMPLAKAVQLIKGGSSKWVHDTFGRRGSFNWQKGYGAFSVSISHVDATVDYIRNQEKHHAKLSFKEEFLAFLKKHRIEYDERYVWG